MNRNSNYEMKAGWGAEVSIVAMLSAMATIDASFLGQAELADLSANELSI